MAEFVLRTPETADAQAAPILSRALKQFGMVPNFYAALGIDGACLQGYLEFEKTVGQSDALSNAQREMIALLVANYNGCEYCVSGHSFSARRAGLSAEACADAQHGKAAKAEDQAMLTLAKRILQHQGHLSADDKAEAFAAGLSESQIIQVAAWTALNSFSNWINNLVQPEIDFPKVALEQTGHGRS